MSGELVETRAGRAVLFAGARQSSASCFVFEQGSLAQGGLSAAFLHDRGCR